MLVSLLDEVLPEVKNEESLRVADTTRDGGAIFNGARWLSLSGSCDHIDIDLYNLESSEGLSFTRKTELGIIQTGSCWLIPHFLVKYSC